MSFKDCIHSVIFVDSQSNAIKNYNGIDPHLYRKSH